MINCAIHVNQIFIWHNSSIKREIRNMYISSSLYRPCVPADLINWCHLESPWKQTSRYACGKFLNWDNWDRKTYLKCRHQYALGWSEWTGESQMSTSIHLFLLPDCGCNVTRCLRVLCQAFPSLMDYVFLSWKTK